MSEHNQNSSSESGVDKRQLIKLAIELGPLIAFFATYVKSGDLFVSTGVLMAATLASLIASRVFLGHVAAMPVVTAVLVLVFGGLTVWLKDPIFIKMKPTILYILFAAVLAGGLYFGKVFLKTVLGEAISYTEEGWRKLTVRWAVFFVVLAFANELIWRNFSDAAWVSFKTFGFLPLTMAFAIAQFILMKDFTIDPETRQ